jgi:hypothetical protein
VNRVTDDQDVVLQAITEAQRILTEYNRSAHSRLDAHETLNMLSFVLMERADLEAAISRLRSDHGDHRGRDQDAC